LRGGIGGTTLFGSAGSNVALAGRQGLLYAAGGGNETVNGAGSSGNNELVGGSGSDLIVGGNGSDTLFAGGGAETLGGGGSNDAFAFVSSLTRGNVVTILDFTSSDAVFLTGYGAGDATTALNGASSSNGNTTLTLTDHTQITFLNVGSANALQGHVLSF
jgi:Ca2+-binding RTX toxin-like protein